MSDAQGEDGPGRREVAYRLFAAEFEDADLEHTESDRERAPNYVITPTGGRVNRLFVVGVLTEVEPVSEEVLRARVVDPTGAFVCYAGQYQPDERAVLDRIETPTFVAVTGKARTFQPEDADRVFTSVRPESVSEVDAATRDRWTVDAAERTLERVEAMATALALGASGDELRTALEERGVEDGLAAGIALALDHYGTTPTYLAAVRDLAIDAARHVGGELDEVPPLDVAPDEPGDVTPADLLEAEVEPLESPSEATESTPEKPEPEPAAAATAASGSEPQAEPEAEPEPEPSTEADESDPTVEPEATTDAGTQADDGTPDDGTPDDETTDETAAIETDADPSTGESEDGSGPGDFDSGEFEMGDEEREAIEEEYGTEFQSGTEVDEPGEADIETPEPDAESAGDPEDDESADRPEDDESAAGSPDEDESDEPDEALDLVDAAVEAMEELDEGNGADRAAVVDAVVERSGAEPDAVEDAIQEALMDGRCYEPDDATLKPI